MYKTLLMLLLSGSLVVPAWAQKCDTAQPASAPLSRFDAGSDGRIMTDGKTGLVWLRCPLGMQWSGSSCEGQSLTYDWGSAKAAVAELNAQRVGGQRNWRLPTVTELQGIVESRCFKPAIDLQAFPFTPESGFWSATEIEGINNVRALIVHFIHGREYIANKQQSWRVRPVADK